MSYNKESGMYEGYIYCITNNINGKKYIGQTSDTIEKRFKSHTTTDKNSKMVIKKAIMKYGKENFSVRELLMCSCDTFNDLKSMLNYLEILLIKSNNSLVQNGHGYNVSVGGDAGSHFTAIDIYDISGNFLETLESVAITAKKYDVSIGTIYLVCKGKQPNYNNELVFRIHGDLFDKYSTISLNKKEVYQFDVNGNLINHFNSVTEASNNVGLRHETSISVALDNVNLLSAGYWWSTNNKFNYQGSLVKRKIKVYTKQGVLLEICESISEASQKYKVQISNIGKVCNGRRISTGNLIFRYEEDDFNKYPVNPRYTYNKRWVNQYDKNDEYINTYYSIVEATKSFTNSSSVAIYNCCSKKEHYNTAFGFKWYYADDENQPDKDKIIKKEEQKCVQNINL